MLKPTLAISVLALALSACTTTQSVKPEHAHAYSHDHHHDHDHGWDYAHIEKWGDLEVNKLCGTVVEQSPINIDTVVKPRPDSQGNFTLTRATPPAILKLKTTVTPSSLMSKMTKTP